jgi:hypothetical protein
MAADEPNFVTIGGERIQLPAVMNFAVLRRVLPGINASAAATEKFAQDAAHICVVAALLVETRPEFSVVEIEKRLLINMRDGSDERPGLADAVNKLIEVSGLVPLEPVPAGDPALPAENPLT